VDLLQNFGSIVLMFFSFSPGPLYSDVQLKCHMYLASHTVDLPETRLNTVTVADQQDAAILIYLLLISSTRFGRCFHPSSGAYRCIYSFRYCPPMLLLAGVAYWVEPTSSSIGGQYQKL